MGAAARTSLPLPRPRLAPAPRTQRSPRGLVSWTGALLQLIDLRGGCAESPEGTWPGMPVSALHVATNVIHAAADLVGDDELRAAEWRCPGCSAAMSPVAVHPERTFDKTPHFRVEGSHEVTCTSNAALDLVHPVRRPSKRQRAALLDVAPTSLRLASPRNAVAEAARSPTSRVGWARMEVAEARAWRRMALRGLRAVLR